MGGRFRGFIFIVLVDSKKARRGEPFLGIYPDEISQQRFGWLLTW